MFIFCELYLLKYQSLQIQTKNTKFRPLNLEFRPPKWSDVVFWPEFVNFDTQVAVIHKNKH